MSKCFVISSFMFLVHFGMHDCFNFEAESETFKGINLNLVCSVDRPSDFTAPISLLKDGISKSTCDNANNCVPSNSDSSRYQYFSNGTSVTVEITSLNHLADSGFWKCKLGQVQEKDYELVVKTFPIYKEFTQTIPDPNSLKLVENVQLSGRCYCIFPPPSEVKIFFRVGTGAFQFHQKISDRFINKRNDTSSCEPYEFDVEVSNFTVEKRGMTNVFFEMHFGDYKTSRDVGPFSFSFKGLTTPSSIFSSDMSTTVSEPLSTINSDMSTTVSEPSSTFSSDMPTTVSEAPLPPITTSSTGLSQEIVITIAISCILAAGLLILLVVLVVKQCRRKSKGTPPKNKKNHFANKQNNLTKNFKDNLKSYKPRKSKLIKKRNTKRGSSSIDKKKNGKVENFAPKDRMYQHYPQTTENWNNSGNQHVFNISHNEGNMMLYGNWHDNYLRPHSRPNNRMLYQSHYPEYPGHNEGLFQYYKAVNLYRSTGQQMYQRPYGALYDMHIIDDKQDDKRSFTGRPYEKNWDLLY